MEYLEPLPDDCPIDKAGDIEVDTAWRIVSSNPPTIKDFLSNAALGIPCSAISDPCRHASCSLFKSKDKVLNIASKLPKLRMPQPHLALCVIKTGVGKSYINRKKHVDFWPYKNFTPNAIVIKTDAVP